MRHVHLEELGVGPDVEDMVSFLSSCLEWSRREYTWDLYKLCCLCLGHVAPKLPDVSLGSGKVGVTSFDLLSVVEPIHGYMLSGDSEGNFFIRIQGLFRVVWNCLRHLVIGRYNPITNLGNQLMLTDTRIFELNWRSRIEL